MTELIALEPGQWVLAFDEPYGPHFGTMAEHLERFTSRGGGWESDRKEAIFHVYRVTSVKPKTYFVDEVVARARAHVPSRLHRMNVVAAFDTKEEAIALRDRFFAIGVEADDQINFVVDRLARPVRKRVYAKALREVHACLPHIFGRKT